MVLLLMFLSMILHCRAENLLKNDFIAITNINVDIFENTWTHVWLPYREQIIELCQSFRNLPIFKISTTVEDKYSKVDNLYLALKIFSEKTIIDNAPELNYGLFLTENWKSEKVLEKDIYITFKNQKSIPAIRCSWGKSIIYLVKSNQFRNGYVLFWTNEYFGLQFLGLTLNIHNMEVIEENPASLKDYGDSWDDYLFRAGSKVSISLLPYKYLIWELCASTLVNFMGEKIRYMNIESLLKSKELNFPHSSKKRFFNSKLKVLVLQCKTESPHKEYYLIINPQNKKQLYVGTDDKMPSLLVELSIHLDNTNLNPDYRRY